MHTFTEKYVKQLSEDLDNNALTSPELQESLRIVAQHRDALLGSLTNEQLQLFHTYETQLADSVWLSKLAFFSYALNMGIHMTQEALGENEHT